MGEDKGEGEIGFAPLTPALRSIHTNLPQGEREKIRMNAYASVNIIYEIQ
jgi:hypothetical protein